MKLQELIKTFPDKVNIENNIEKNTARVSVITTYFDDKEIQKIMGLLIKCEDIDLVLFLEINIIPMSYEFEIEYIN